MSATREKFNAAHRPAADRTPQRQVTVYPITKSDEETRVLLAAVLDQLPM